MSQRVNFNSSHSGISSSPSFLSSLYQLSGLALYLIIPAMLWITHLSLQSTYQFSEARYWLFHPIGKGLAAVACALCLYHSLIGLYNALASRYKILDKPMMGSIIILMLTLSFGGGIGYWLW